jgi:peptidoglycan/LPS O-acetylase OafA/YrhL
MADQTSPYRADVDGLRAVAVLAVIGFHAQLRFFHAGFAGVDVFFVISGYLISGLILRSLERGNFSFTEFYARRINRLFPSLIVVLLTILLLGWAILFRREYALLGKHTAVASVFGSNFLLWSEAGYFDSTHKPLLHLWSLGVEEQFYLVWPVSLLLLSKKKAWLIPSIVVIGVISFVIGWWQTGAVAGAGAFFSPVARLWELSVGALISVGEIRRATRKDPLPSQMLIPTALSCTGAILCLATLFIVNGHQPWPGPLTALPVIGTGMLLAAGPAGVVNRFILRVRWLVSIGLVSYPLYLWHWPLLVFASLIERGGIPWPIRAAVIALSFVLAYATYGIVEKPIRFGKRKKRSAVILLCGMSGVGLAGLLVASQRLSPRLDRFSDPEKAWGDWDYPERGVGADGMPQPVTINGDGQKTIVLIGDSHMAQYFPRLKALIAASPTRAGQAEFLTFGACPPLPGVNLPGIAWHAGPVRCHLIFNAAIKAASDPRVAVVVFAAYWEAYENRVVYSTSDPSHTLLNEGSAGLTEAYDGLEKEIARLIGSGKKVYIVLSNPASPAYDPRSILPDRIPHLPKHEIRLSIPAREFLAETAGPRDRLQRIARETGAILIDPVPSMCPQMTCPTVDDKGLPIYRDGNHMRATFARSRATFIDRVLEN